MVHLSHFTEVVEIDYTVIDSFLMRLLALGCDLGQVEHLGIDLELIDELTLLVDQLLLELTFAWIVELLTALEESSRLLAAKHLGGVSKFSLPTVLNDCAGDFFVDAVPFA